MTYSVLIGIVFVGVSSSSLYSAPFEFTPYPSFGKVDVTERMEEWFGGVIYASAANDENDSFDSNAVYLSNKLGVADSGKRDATINVEDSHLSHFIIGDFEVWLDCTQPTKALQMAYAQVRKDTGNEKRSNSFYISEDIPRNCQQKSTSTYSSKIAKSKALKFVYDRGHSQPSNMYDYSKAAIKNSNLMVNVVPQISVNNRPGGAWYRTELIVECLRDRIGEGDIERLDLFTGVIWGDEDNDDIYLETHGTATPSYLWKVMVQYTQNSVTSFSWLIPNETVAKDDDIDSFLVSPSKLFAMGSPKTLIDSIPESTWAQEQLSSPAVPKGCNPS